MEITCELVFSFLQLDHAAKIKSTPEAEKSFAATKSALDDVFTKLA